MDWNDVHQVMEGWGGQTVGPSITLNSTQADLLFSTTSGIGLNYIRTQNTDAGNQPDLGSLQLAVARGALVELGLQSPPASMKVSGSFNDGTGGINTADYGAYASYIVTWIQTLQAAGVPVAIVDVQNEPDISFSNLGACLWTAQQLHDFISGFLGPALASAGLLTKVMLGSVSGWFNNDLVSTCLNDASCKQYVSIVAGHGYDTSNNGSPDGFPGQPAGSYCCHQATNPPSGAAGKEIGQSEVNGGFTFNSGANLWNWDPSIADGIVWARNIHDFLTIPQVSLWEYWALTDCCGGPYNDGFTDPSYNVGKRYYVIGQWSKFVRAGWVRIGVTSNPVSGVFVTAFKSPSNANYAIVVVNQNTSSTSLTLASTNFSFGTATPTVTSATQNMAQGSSFAGGTSFGITAPAQSVTTYYGAPGGGGGGTPIQDIYASQNGTGTGASCTNPVSVAYLNNSGNWGGSGIGAGTLPTKSTTIHLCDAFVGASVGSTMLSVQGSGVSGNPVTFLCESAPHQCSFSAPVWLNGGSGHGGAINTNGQNYLSILGGPACGINLATLTGVPCNGVIQNTANGTSLANQQASLGVEIFNSHDVRLAYWQINNMYVRTGTGTDPNPTDPNTINALKIDGSSFNIQADHFSMQQDSWAIDATGGTGTVEIGPGVDLWNNCHSIAISSVNWKIHDFHMHDWSNWDSAANICHEDGVHCYSITAGAGNTLKGIIYDGYFDGQTGANAQQYLFPESGSDACFVPGGKLYDFNIVNLSTVSPPSQHQEAMTATYGNATTGNNGDVIANILALGQNPADGSSSAVILQNSQNCIHENNAIGGVGVLISGFNFQCSAFDYDAYENNTGFNAWSPTGIDTSSFTAWQGFNCAGSSNSCDQHGTANLGSSTYFGLPAGCIPGALLPSCAPLPGSPLIATGANLTALANSDPDLAPLAFDIQGNPRPATGPWNKGPFQQGGTVPPGPPAVPILIGLLSTKNYQEREYESQSIVDSSFVRLSATSRGAFLASLECAGARGPCPARDSAGHIIHLHRPDLPEGSDLHVFNYGHQLGRHLGTVANLFARQ